MYCMLLFSFIESLFTAIRWHAGQTPESLIEK